MRWGRGMEIENYLQNAINGSSMALGKLLEAFREPLHQNAAGQIGSSLQGKVGVSDLVQESLVAAAVGFPEFRGKSVGEFQVWITQILEHRAIDLARRFRGLSRDISREAKQGEMLIQSFPDSQPDLPDQAVYRETLQRLVDTLNGFSSEERQLVQWRYEDNLSFEEMAHRLGIPRETVRRRWYHIIETIGRNLEEH